MAWDALSGRWALAYVRSGTSNVRIKRYPNGASITSDASTDFLSPYKQVDLAWNGQNGGWLFQGQLTDNRQVFVALDADLVQRASNATQISWTGADSAGPALACPGVTALPVLDLRMEELPGATGFVDSSSRGNNAICGSASQCPAAGALGGSYANGTAIGGGAQGPASDYAVTFNSNQYLRVPNNATLAFDATRSFTWLTWVKTTVGSPIMRKGLGNVNDLLLSITTDTGRLRMGFGNINTNTLTATDPDLRDNQWHQVGVTLNRATNTATLYVDGAARGSGSFTGSFVTTDALFIGSSNVTGYVGALDNLQIYPSALGADTISALYNRTLQAYCVGSSPTQTGNGVQWAKLIVRQPDQRGGAITVSNSINLTVDGDQPTASIALPAAVTVQGGNSAAPRVFVIGGTASDPTSSIGLVEVSINNGPWQAAAGAESWAFALPLAADGHYAIRTRATDAVGNVGTPSAAVTLFVDGTAPQMSINLSSVKTTFRTINKQYYVFLQGAVADPPIPGGNLNTPFIKAQVQLFNGGGQAVSEPQSVSRNPDGSWQLFYLFPDGEKAPTGPYSVELQATDGVGNQFKQRVATPLGIDSLGPVTTLTKSDVSKGVLSTVITGTVTVGGQISETLAVGSANVNFTPLQQVLPYADSVLQLNLEEQSLGVTVAGPVPPTFFADSSTQFNHAICGSLSQCPQIGATGKVGSALTFNGNQYLRVRNHPTLNFDAASSFSWQAWVRTNATPNSNPILRKGQSNTADLLLSINSGGQAEMGFNTLSGANRLFGGPNLRDNQWHQIVVSVNRANNQAELFVDGVSYGRGGFSGNFTTPDDLLIGSSNAAGYQGVLDQIAIFRHALNAAEVQALYQATSRPSYPATVTGASWNRQVPAGLEGLYQIDLPAVDTVGNSVANGNLWRGLIDNVAPRVTLTGRTTGQSYLDTATNTPRYAINYTCRADDFQLNEASFTCAGNSQRPPAKTFNSDPLLKQQFPDLTVLSTLVNTYTVWAASPTPTGTLTACDAYGHCTTANATATGAAASTSSAALVEAAAVTAGPQSAILAPTAGSVVNSTNAVQVSVAARADQPIKEMAILLDNTPVSTITFTQPENVKQTVQTAAVTIATAGAHTVAARVTDWSGVQSQPVTLSFIADRQAPVVVLSNSLLTKADSYGAQTNVLRFRGTASDDTGLVAVQVKVGDQPYADATIDNGAWQIAYPVPDPEGKQLAVKVRALDAANNVTEISQLLGTDLSVADAPDTTLMDKPADPNGSTNATFTFTGSATAVAFKCQLDETPAAPCSSPWSLTDLSNGSHTVKVAALNSQGFPDLSPATYTWTINVTTLATTLTAKPDAPTTNRTASFAFAATGAGSFECSLDGGAYAPCTSPQSYAKLGNGNHAFLVRAKVGTTNGPATRYVWRVTNATPTVAGDQVLMVVENSAVNVTLQGNDSDALTFQIIEQPQHGLLLGQGANLTYVPNTGYAGPDRFVYRAWDGEAASASATVNLTVRLAKYAVFAQEGVAFDQNSAVVRGDVGVNVKSAGPFLRNNVEASFSQNSAMQDPTSRVLADSIVVDQNGKIYNPSYNDLTAKGNVLGTRTTPLALPLRTGLPALPTITPGAQAVAVNGSQTLAAGSYGALTVNGNAILVLSGGLYQFTSWTVSQNAKVYFVAPSEVRIASAVSISQNAFVGPQPGATTVDANRIVLYVAGTDGQSGPGNQPRAVAVDQNTTLSAYVVAPNGTINFRQNVNATGAFIGKWVLAEQNAKVTRPADPQVQAAGGSNQESAVVITSPTLTPTVDTTANALFLPLINANAVAASAEAPLISETVVSETVVSETVVSETVTLTLPSTTLPVLTTTTTVTTSVITSPVPITSTVPVTPTVPEQTSTTAVTPGTIYLPLLANATP